MDIIFKQGKDMIHYYCEKIKADLEWADSVTGKPQAELLQKYVEKTCFSLTIIGMSNKILHK